MNPSSCRRRSRNRVLRRGHEPRRPCVASPTRSAGHHPRSGPSTRSPSARLEGLSAAWAPQLDGSPPFVAKHSPTNVPQTSPRLRDGLTAAGGDAPHRASVQGPPSTTSRRPSSTTVLRLSAGKDRGGDPRVHRDGSGVAARQGDNATGTRVSAMFVRLGSPEADVATAAAGHAFGGRGEEGTRGLCRAIPP